jgi:hypothetical protein
MAMVLASACASLVGIGDIQGLDGGGTSAAGSTSAGGSSSAATRPSASSSTVSSSINGNSTSSNHGNGISASTSNGAFGNTSTNGGSSTRGSTSSSRASTTSTAAGGNTGCPAATGAYASATSCSATQLAGALSLSNCFYTSANPSTMGEGYAYVFGDGTSTVCLDSSAFCTKGQVGSSSMTGIYGAGIGVNVNESSGGAAAGTVTPTATGLTYTLAGAIAPTNGIQISIVSDAGPCTAASSGGVGCCARIGLAGTLPLTATIPWSSFVPGCYNAADAGTTGFQPSEGIDQINFQVIAGTAPTSYDFCLLQLAY